MKVSKLTIWKTLPTGNGKAAVGGVIQILAIYPLDWQNSDQDFKPPKAVVKVQLRKASS